MGTTAIEIHMKMAAAWKRLAAAAPQYIIAGAIQHAMLGAHLKFHGRDRRRIKREVRKAARNARARLRTAELKATREG